MKDAFGISENEHNEMFEKVKTRDFSEVETVDGPIEATKPENCQPAPENNNFEALDSHSTLMKVLLKHELEVSQAPFYYWNGKFSFLASTILQLHSKFKCLTAVNLMFARWFAFTDINQHYPLDLRMFTEILNSIIEVRNNNFMAVAETHFLTSAKVLLPTCFGMASKFIAGMKDSELEKPIYDQLATKDEQAINRFWEGTRMLSKSLNQFIIDLNQQEDELENIKVEILRKAFIIINKTKRLSS